MAQDLFAYIHSASYVHATEDEELLWVWQGGSIFNLYDINGDCLDCFTIYGIENPAQAEQAIENHIRSAEAEKLEAERQELTERLSTVERTQLLQKTLDSLRSS